MTITKLWTVAEVARLPEDHHRYDLVGGELYRMPPSEDRHGGVSGTITSYVGAFNLRERIGRLYTAEAGFWLARDPDTLVAPDVALVLTPRVRPKAEQRGFLPMAPDLAVEVISPSESRRHIEGKIAAYMEAGTRLLWVVWPRRQTVTVYEPGREPRELGVGDVLDGGDVLPGFSVTVADIFE